MQRQLATLCLILLASWAAAEVNLDYSEIQSLGYSCPQLDSCDHNDTSDPTRAAPYYVRDKNCACDEMCPEYADCCIDAPRAAVRADLTDYTCYDLKQFGGIFMKGTCPRNFTGPEAVRRLCEAEGANFGDPVGAMPATNPITGVTYKNYYCGICHGDAGNVSIWAPRLECPTVSLVDEAQNFSAEYVFSKLVLVGDSWGLYLEEENGSMFFHDCDVDPVVPYNLQGDIRECKPDLISDCPPDYPDEGVRALCTSYMGSRYVHGGPRYRNAHCALCNGENVTNLSCQTAATREYVLFRQYIPQAFSRLLDINEARGDEVGFVKKCGSDEVFDPFFKGCRSLTCLPEYVRRGDKCVLRDIDEDLATAIPHHIVPIISADGSEVEGSGNLYKTFDNLNVVPSGDAPPSSNYSADGNDSSREAGKIRDCLLITLREQDYVMLSNMSLYVPKYDKVYGPGSYHSVDDAVMVCSPSTSPNQEKFQFVQGYITIVGLGISMVCLVLHFVAFCLVPDLRNLSGKSLVSQCASLFFAYACFIVGLFDSESLGYELCSAVAFGTFYFFQATFFWMVSIAFDVWRTLRMATTELRVASGSQMRRFFGYSLFAWTTPLVLVGVLALAEYTDLLSTPYRPGFAEPTCWFRRRRALLVFFAAPLTAVVVVNVAFFVSSSRMILLTTRSGVKQHSEAQRRNYKLYMRLALLMGLTWAVGVVAGYSDLEVLWYLFVVFNTLQGLFIFAAFTCSTKVVKFLKARLWKRAQQSQEATSHSATTGSGCHTNSTNVHSNLAKKVSSKLLLKHRDSRSSTGSVKSHQTNAAF